MSRNFELMQLAGKLPEIEPAGKLEHVSPRPLAVPRVDSWNRRASANHLGADHMVREESLRLVQQVFLTRTEESPRAIVFAGIDHGNGCSRICASAAEALRDSSQGSVCIVEANFRSPSMPRLFGTSNHYGLTNALVEDGPVRAFAKPLASENLWLMSSGALETNSPNLLNSDRLLSRFDEMRKEFDYLMIDAPPLTRYSDAIALGKVADGFVLVIEANATRRDSALRVAEYLRASEIRVLGAVLNKRTFPIPKSLYRNL